MAIEKTNSIARHTSLPSLSDPLTLSVEEHLHRLRSSSEATSSSLCQNLDGLKELYECVDCWLQLALTQQALINKQYGKCVEQLLDGSLRLLDLCSTMKDALSQLRTCMQDLESSLRRRSPSCEIKNYIHSKKMVTKIISGCTNEIKKMQKHNLENIGTECEEIVMLREVEAVGLGVFASLFSFVCPSKTKSRSLLPKFMQSKRVSCEVEAEDPVYCMEKIDIVLHAQSKQKSNKSICGLQKDLATVEAAVKQLEEGLECLFRCLLKNRVSLLNILNN